jgi:hypothetical protein
VAVVWGGGGIPPPLKASFHSIILKTTFVQSTKCILTLFQVQSTEVLQKSVKGKIRKKISVSGLEPLTFTFVKVDNGIVSSGKCKYFTTFFPTAGRFVRIITN